jgi:archaellum component FlaG (FlaF/FlaG flagellin family)
VTENYNDSLNLIYIIAAAVVAAAVAAAAAAVTPNLSFRMCVF